MEAYPSPPRNLCKVFILFGLDLDLGFCIWCKVLILLGSAVGDGGKVFISISKAPAGRFPRGFFSFFFYSLSIEELG
jgi:hypothetical protein